MVTFNRFAGLFLLAQAAFLFADTPATYTIQTLAGTDSVGDGGPALSALLSQPEGVAVDALGAIYVADAALHRVRKITPDGKIQTVAGTGIAGFAGDASPASTAALNQPYGLAVGASGNLYIADLGNARVRKISSDGTIQTVAGGGANVPGGNGDGGVATSAQLIEPRNVALGPDGTLYISDFGANRVYSVSPNGTLTTLAGTGNSGFSGDGGNALLAQLNAPAGLAVDSNGTVYIADSGNNRIRKVSAGVINTIDSVASPTGLAIASGTLYVAAGAYFGTLSKFIAGVTAARDVALDQSGDAYFTSGQFASKVTAAGVRTTVAGSGGSLYFGGDNGPATSARLQIPAGITIDNSGNYYIADTANNRIRKVAAGGTITTIAGTGDAGSKGDNGPATSAQLNAPASVAVDSSNYVYIADTANNAIRKVTPGGVISTVLTGLNAPQYVAFGPGQSIYVADTGNNRVLKLPESGTVTALTQVLQPTAVALDGSGNLFISNQTSVSKLTPAGGLSTVLSGLNAPRGLAISSSGDLLIAESGANVIRRVTSSGTVSIVAGTGTAGFSGDGAAASAAELNSPQDLAVDSSGNILIADSGNNRIRILTPETAPAAALSAITVTNAASLLPGPIAPGEIISVFGSGFEPNQTALLFDGQPSTVFYTGATQINALAPSNLAPGSSTTIGVTVNGVTIATSSVTVAAASPGVFTLSNGTGQAAVINEDGTVNSASNPAPRGSVVSIYATGGGSDLSTASVTIDNYPAQLPYAGPAPGFPGLMQINTQVPAGFLAPGIEPIVLTVGNATSQSGVTIALR